MENILINQISFKLSAIYTYSMYCPAWRISCPGGGGGLEGRYRLTVPLSVSSPFSRPRAASELCTAHSSLSS